MPAIPLIVSLIRNIARNKPNNFICSALTVKITSSHFVRERKGAREGERAIEKERKQRKRKKRSESMPFVVIVCS